MARLRSLWRNLVRRERVDADLDEELQATLERTLLPRQNALKMRALLAALGVLFNLWIVRAPRTEAWKSVVILTVFVVAVVLLTAWAFFYGWILSLFGR